MSSRQKNFRAKNSKVMVIDLVDCALENVKNNPEKIGVLLCEGDENSIDKVIYSAIFPDLHVIPLQSCTTVMRAVSRVRKHLAPYDIYVFGIIDRDALSKGEIKRMLKERQVYTTKLPFIENIICAPGVIKILCDDLGLDYERTLEKIHEQLIKILWQKFKEALPINLGIEKNEKIVSLKIGAETKWKNIEKEVSRENILYAYRSKVIVSVVASVMHIDGRSAYYAKIKQIMEDERYRDSLIKVVSQFVPKLVFYNFDEL